LHDAAKFTRPRGSITEAMRRADAHVEVIVQETGAGIAPDASMRIFDLFTQVTAGGIPMWEAVWDCRSRVRSFTCTAVR
jgi:signal transduction histidine kinase